MGHAIAYIHNEQPILIWAAIESVLDAISVVPEGVSFIWLSEEEAIAWLNANTPPDTLANTIRQQRDELLSNCDWTMLDDCPISEEEKQSWKTYRQELRDITNQPEFPKEVVWPER